MPSRRPGRERRGDNGMAQVPGGQRRASDNGMPVMPSAAGGDRRGADGRGDNGRRPSTGPNQRRGSNGRPQRPDQGNPPARPRPARGKRSEDSSEWDSSEWDKLSDVDYWATLASEKPLSTAKPAPERRSDRPDSGSEPPRLPAPGPGRGSAPGPRHRPSRAQPPAGPRRRTGPRGRRRLRGGTRSRSAEPARSRACLSSVIPAARIPAPPTFRTSAAACRRPRLPPPPAVLDDDPLTSPSFPKVPASDSRSYRNSRHDQGRHPRRFPRAGPALLRADAATPGLRSVPGPVPRPGRGRPADESVRLPVRAGAPGPVRPGGRQRLQRSARRDGKPLRQLCDARQPDRRLELRRIRHAGLLRC